MTVQKLTNRENSQQVFADDEPRRSLAVSPVLADLARRWTEPEPPQPARSVEPDPAPRVRFDLD
jgi:hypothetical protein